MNKYVKVKCIRNAYCEKQKCFTKYKEYFCYVDELDSICTIDDVADKHWLYIVPDKENTLQWFNKHFKIIATYKSTCKLKQL